MVNNSFSSGYVNIGGIPLGQPINSPFNPVKHLENNSYINAFGVDNTWLGIINVLEKFNKMVMPFISMTELSKNVLEVEGPGSKFTFGVPFLKGAPYLVENLCKDNPKPGYGNQPFFIVLSENCYYEGDVLTTDFMNGKQLVVQRQKDKGEEAEIIKQHNGYRYMVALDSWDEEDYYSQDFLMEGTPYIKLGNNDRGEFDSGESGYSGMDGDARTGLQLYEYTVGNSQQAIKGWVTADATYRKFNFDTDRTNPNAMGLPKEASTDINFYWTQSDTNKKTPVFWIPQFIEKIMGELAAMKERMLVWNQGHRYTNGREVVMTGLGWYQQIKQRGNYDTYSDFRQLLNIILNFGEKLFSIHNDVRPEDRLIQVRAGSLAYTNLIRQFGQYFKTDNPFITTLEHPALVDVLRKEKDGSLIYHPIKFTGIYFPGMGTLKVVLDTTLDKLGDYLESPQMTSGANNYAGMIFIEDISSNNFTNAIPEHLKDSSMKYRNTTMIKRKGWRDGIEFLRGSSCSTELLQMIGAYGTGNNISTWNKGLELRAATEGEVWVQNPSKCWIIEYDPTGSIAENNRNYSLNKI